MFNKKNWLLVFFLIFITLQSYADLSGGCQSGDEDLQIVMEELLSQYSIPDLPGGLLFSRLDHKRVKTWTAGEIEKDSALRIASLSKIFISSLVLRCRSLSPRRTIETWYPADQYPHSDKITIGMLLSHTSGIPNYLPYVDLGSYLPKTDMINAAYNMGKEPDFPPGTRWCYSNTNYIILGDILEQETGYPVNELLKKVYGRIAPSLYIDDGRPNNFPVSYFDPWPLHWSAPWTAGGMICQAEELLKAFRRLSRNKRLFKKMQTWATQPMCENDVTFADKYGYGLEAFDFGDLGMAIGHDGDIICRSLLIKLDRQYYFIHTTWPVNNEVLKAIAVRLLEAQ